ncbi:hypothetical protein P3T23_002687 [Paraburkholderia sp. GAS448]|uniref:hypothetical protein n=1 Tax=Paraburkholderia sp. GAS448 TaxID=3035136 RepID=UPI003D20DAD7
MKIARWLRPHGFRNVSPDIRRSRTIPVTPGRLGNPRKNTLAAARNVAYTNIAGAL